MLRTGTIEAQFRGHESSGIPLFRSFLPIDFEIPLVLRYNKEHHHNCVKLNKSLQNLTSQLVTTQFLQPPRGRRGGRRKQPFLFYVYHFKRYLDAIKSAVES
jgi:hypothetical protein